jgi:hypothetical protein
MHDDNMYHVPSNISCVVDILEDKHVSWATYQESLPTDGFYGYQCAAFPLIILSLGSFSPRIPSFMHS